VPKDLQKAAELFQEAAKQGYAAAQYNLGVCYQAGQGVPKDLEKAAELFEKAAAQGYPAAQYELGVLYTSGQGVPTDSKKAEELFRKAADAKAQIESLRSFELAFIDEFGVPGKGFSDAAFDARVDEGNAKFQQAIANETFTALRPVLVDLKEQFDADAAHLRSKASRGKVTRALASEMKKDVNRIYDHALGW
jgi:TPR repeat protein